MLVLALQTLHLPWLNSLCRETRNIADKITSSSQDGRMSGSEPHCKLKKKVRLPRSVRKMLCIFHENKFSNKVYQLRKMKTDNLWHTERKWNWWDSITTIFSFKKRMRNKNACYSPPWHGWRGCYYFSAFLCFLYFSKRAFWNQKLPILKTVRTKCWAIWCGAQPGSHLGFKHGPPVPDASRPLMKSSGPHFCPYAQKRRGKCAQACQKKMCDLWKWREQCNTHKSTL